MGSIVEDLNGKIEVLSKASGLMPEDSTGGEQAVSVAAEQTPSPTEGQHTSTEPPTAIGTVQEGVVATVTNVTLEGTPQPDTQPTKSKRTSWKNRFKKLKAHHDASRFKDRQVMEQAFSRIAVLERDNASLRDTNEKLISESKAQGDQDYSSIVTPEERDVIGDAGVSSISKFTERAVEQAVAPLKEQLKAAEEERIISIEGKALDAKQEAASIFKQRLGNLVEDYETIDADPGFETFLNQPDAASGFSRFSLFKQAQNSGDVGRVAGFFNEYKSTLVPGASNNTLEGMVTPVGTSTSNDPNNVTNESDTGEMFLMSDYSAFISDLTKGLYRGRQAEADAIEAKFSKAFEEGRIR